MSVPIGGYRIITWNADILGKALGSTGTAPTEDTSATFRPGVFAGGDLVRGASTVVAAVADGMAAANQINKFLKR